MLKSLGLLLVLMVGLQSHAYELPTRPIVTLPPIIKLPPLFPGAGVGAGAGTWSPIGMGGGGVTVGGGELTSSLCVNLNNVSLNKEGLKEEEVSSVRETRLEVMVNIAKTFQALDAKKARGRLSAEEREAYHFIVNRLEALPPTKAEVMLDVCSRGEEKISKKITQESLAYLEQAFEYLVYYSSWYY